MADETFLGAWVDDVLAAGKQVALEATTLDKEAKFNAWEASARHFMAQLLPEDHIYTRAFNRARQVPMGPSLTSITNALDETLEVLSALAKDLKNGRLISFREFITAEVFADFLEMALHLLEFQYKDAAASLVGAVLERELKSIANANGIVVKSRDDLTSVANKLFEKHVINRVTQKNLSVWITIRNHADHGEFEKYSLSDVTNMHSGVSTFLSQFLPG